MEEVEKDGGAVATGAQTRAALLRRAKWDMAPIHDRFVQLPKQPHGSSRAGQLAGLVNCGDKRGLNAYLLLASVISRGDGPTGWSTDESAGVLARALGTDRNASGKAATNAVSKVLRRLENRNLIQRSRVPGGRNVRITLLDPDGSGDPYERPLSQYLRLTHRYFLDGWFERLSLPAIAMLLVLLKEKDNCRLPTANFPDWYGWSADTAERGLRSLTDEGLLTVIRRYRTEPLSPTGRSMVKEYRLTAALRPSARRSSAEPAAAESEASASLLASTPTPPTFAELFRAEAAAHAEG